MRKTETEDCAVPHSVSPRCAVERAVGPDKRAGGIVAVASRDASKIVEYNLGPITACDRGWY